MISNYISNHSTVVHLNILILYDIVAPDLVLYYNSISGLTLLLIAMELKY